MAPASPSTRRWGPWALLGLLLVLPYARLLTFRAVNLADDIFVADLLGGELPARATMGRALRSGHLPLWEPGVYTGFPIVASGGALDPINGLLFAALPPAAAYDAFLLLMLLVAGFGAARLARVLGASVTGAMLSALVWAHGGVLVSQWRHLGVLGTLAWFPLALSLIEEALGPRSDGARRDRALLLFSAVLGLQVLASFPQSLYACLLAYGLWAVARALDASRDARGRLLALGRFTMACMIGVGLGAAQLLPMAELGALSSRGGGVTWEFAARWRYWPPNLLALLVPYPFGDVSDGTYRGPDLFWESHGYLGLCTAPLALVALWSDRRRAVWALGALGLLGILFALGPATPVYRVAFAVLPGIKSFRFPQRFLFVACGALAVLAGLGLTRAGRWWSGRRAAGTSRITALHLGGAVVALTAIDLALTQPRQNPLDDAGAWLSPPAAVRALAREPVGRVYSMESSAVHQRAYRLARGWSDLEPYRVARELIQPNANLYWSLPAPDGYAGLLTREMERCWGPMSPLHDALARGSYRAEGDQLIPDGGFVRFLAMHHVTHVLAPTTVLSQRLDPIPSGSWARLYRVRDPLPLAYFVGRAVAAPSNLAAERWIFSEAYSPRREVLIHESRGPLPAAPEPGPPTLVEARVTRPSNAELTATVDAPTAGWLVLAESWYPGWSATIDGREVPVLRANLNQKAVAIPAGSHRVTFVFRPRSLARGAALSGLALACLVASALTLSWRRRPVSDRA